LKEEALVYGENQKEDRESQTVASLPKVGEIVNVVIRSVVVQPGRERCMINLAELYHQGWINRPLFLYMDTAQIRSKAAENVPEGLPRVAEKKK
jgi:hypothetical protein